MLLEETLKTMEAEDLESSDLEEDTSLADEIEILEAHIDFLRDVHASDVRIMAMEHQKHVAKTEDDSAAADTLQARIEAEEEKKAGKVKAFFQKVWNKIVAMWKKFVAKMKVLWARIRSLFSRAAKADWSKAGKTQFPSAKAVSDGVATANKLVAAAMKLQAAAGSKKGIADAVGEVDENIKIDFAKTELEGDELKKAVSAANKAVPVLNKKAEQIMKIADSVRKMAGKVAAGQLAQADVTTAFTKLSTVAGVCRTAASSLASSTASVLGKVTGGEGGGGEGGAEKKEDEDPFALPPELLGESGDETDGLDPELSLDPELLGAEGEDGFNLDLETI